MAKHPFGEFINRQEHQQRAADQAAVAFEERKVTFLVKSLKLDVAKICRQLRQIEEAISGNPNLTFRAFGEAYPAFPLLLGASNLDGVAWHLNAKAMLPSLLKSFNQAPFIPAFEKFLEANPRSASWKLRALVFPRRGIRDGLIIHEADGLDTIPVKDGTTAIFFRNPKSQYRPWVVRLFADALAAIYDNGKGWTPDDS